MQTNPSPTHVLRPAQSQDKWALQQMIWQFTWDEGIQLDVRLFGYALFRIGLIALALWLQLYWRQRTLMVDVQFILTVTSVVTAGLGLFLFSTMMGHLVLRFCGVLLNWSRFQVIEQDGDIVGCALLNAYATHCELAYVFVKPQYRHQGLGSRIVQTLIQQTSQEVYLACKPRVVPFYEQQGFTIQPWQQLPSTAQRCFQLFRPHPRLWGFQLYFMRYMAPSTASIPEAATAEVPFL
ncbi:GNAT family N-acetyltransferase [Acaryochloris sp. IP29b_bin.148]|uniref:GNAT family N-acetyltransferase n=1 Tax=Acaryochloris sp. IP29b_bin.148 TaxID=2969218 RepID=UPI0026380AA9|nr:GNAT family N-acetyltransferase [Acaryochloris sp. IP29b_bin.148]